MAAINWEELDKKPKTEQKAFFDGKFEVETIWSFREIRTGDHLVSKGASGDRYYHHFLCIGHNEHGNPKIIHYYGTSSQSSVSGGTVQEMVLPHKDFLKDEAELEKKAVKRIVWRPEVCRFPVNEVVARACRREEEWYYDMAINNCENFVMWCLFDMNISLQVKPRHIVFKDSSNALWSALLGVLPKAGIPVKQALLKEGNNFVKAAVKGLPSKTGRILSNLTARQALGLGALLEMPIVLFGIYQAYKKWNDGILITSGEEFMVEVIEIITTAASRLGFGFGGMVVGQALIPIPIVGGLVGGLVGCIFGHIISKALFSIF